MFRGLRKQQLC